MKPRLSGLRAAKKPPVGDPAARGGLGAERYVKDPAKTSTLGVLGAGRGDVRGRRVLV